MSFTLTYDLEGGGWATARIKDKAWQYDVGVSYLYDSLRDLAEAAVALRKRAKSAEAFFVDEPGGIQLVLESKSDVLSYELRVFDDWTSASREATNFEVLHQGSTTVPRFVGEVRREMESILQEHKEEGYKAKWKNHSFPIEALRRLRADPPS